MIDFARTWCDAILGTPSTVPADSELYSTVKGRTGMLEDSSASMGTVLVSCLIIVGAKVCFPTLNMLPIMETVCVRFSVYT